MNELTPPGTRKAETVDRVGETLTGSQLIWEALLREGVDVVFGYPGGAIMPAYDAMAGYPIRHILVRHEQGAAHMADGYARASGKVGVAIATSGPGATNLVTGIATAMMDSIPMVCITGQVGSALLGSDAFQETDITGVTLPVTKHNYLVTRPEEIVPALREAFYIARSGRPGPVVVDITKDAQQTSTVFEWSDEPVRLPGYRPEHTPLPEELERAVEMIHESKRPLIFAGHGIVEGNATALLLELVQKSNIPVAQTLLGLGGFPATHPRSLGMMGMHGESWVNTAIQEADLIIALGMRFDDRVTGNVKTYAPHAKKIHVELDPAEINKNVKVDLPLVGDVRQILSAVLPRIEHRERPEWLARIEDLKGDSAVRDIRDLPDTGRLYAAHVIHDLWRLTNGKALIVTDVGQHQMWEAQYYKHDHARRLLTSGGLGTMGFALPASLGARFACPDDEIWVIAGDGGFQMTFERACHLGAGADQGQHRHHQQRLSRHGAAVATVLLRRSLRRHADQEPGFRQARRSAWPLGQARDPAQRDRRRRRRGAQCDGHLRHRVPRRAGRQRLPDGPRRRRPARHDPPPHARRRRSRPESKPQPDLRNRQGQVG